MEYNALIELDVLVDLLSDDDFEDFLEPIVPHHGCVGRSDNALVHLTVTIDAVDAIHATQFVHALMRASYADYRVNYVDVLPTSAFDAIFGFGDYFR
ncbi:hypothetical protein [Rhodococcus sp. O3]|uniref:hypothetical protein n=1 Tax=Rhodococcus sp. O3 TaxID=3404919 RepID=UPI003B6743CC